MAKLSLAFGLAVAAASFLASASAQNPWHCDNVNAEVKQGNPLGTCACEGHLWIAPGCQEGFFCHDASGEGCYLVNY